MNSSASIKDVILDHYKRYPKMEAQDYIKLLYQSAFGCGHILNKYSKEYLDKEYHQFSHDFNETYYIEIGNGYYRLDISHTNLDVETIFSLMKKANKIDKAANRLFQEYIDVLLILSKNKEIPLDYLSLVTSINEYQKEGCPIPSHSETYKKLYKPAYRVIRIAH